MKNWYAIYVRPRSEKKVAKVLSDVGIDHYLPLQRSLRKWSDRKKWIDMPLIPGYCFVHLDLADRLQVLTLPNVLQFVRFAGQPAMIQTPHIEFMKRMLSQTEVAFEISDHVPEPGQTVEIISGPMIGLQAEMVSEKGRSRIIVRLEALGNIIQVEVPLTQVTIIGEAVTDKR
jgi:transcription antitermination factor NusG